MKKNILAVLQRIKEFFISRQFRIALISILLFIVVTAGLYLAYSFAYKGKIFPNVYIGKINFGGMTKGQAKEKLNSQINETKDKDLTLSYQDKNWQISGSVLDINYNVEKSVNSLYLVGRENNVFVSIKERILLIFKNKKILAEFSYNIAKVDDFFSKIEAQLDIPEKDATLNFSDDSFEIVKEQVGREANAEKLNSDFAKEIGYLNDRKMEIEVVTENPKLYENQMTAVKEQAERIASGEITLKSEKDDFQVKKSDIASWLEVIAVPPSEKTVYSKNKVYAKENIKFSPKIIFNPEKIKVYIGDLSGNLNMEPVDAKLTISGGRAVVFAQSKDGYKLDQDKTLELILNVLQKRINVAGVSSEGQSSQSSEIELPLQNIKPLVTTDTIDTLGIKELIGKGTTNFKGSPQNRITNIKVGSSMFNGALIKPGEIFSTTGTLGEVSAEKGFLPELVIKEDTTKPEIGGGLCQVSTTLFRAALNSGLPITERSNHRYRVSYYEPPIGMDATIYDPSPDLKFENNTSGYILIQTYVSGTELTFEFYGTKDGRNVEISDPVMYDVTSPGDPIYKEDSSLAPGETKQKEKAHNGSKASFHYKVTKNGETLFEKTFISSYVPWRAVFLVGPGGMPSDQQNQNQQQQTTPENPPPNPTPPPTPEPTPTPTP